MKFATRRICRLVIGVTTLFLLGFSPVTANEPALARLSFWVPPDQMAEFEVTYEEQVLPILKKHGLVESSRSGRATADSIFSRLFESATPSEALARWEGLQSDSTWTVLLKDLARTFGTIGSGNPTPHDFGLYEVPAGSGKIRSAGPGRVIPAGPGIDRWNTYDVADGLPGESVRSIFQDQESNIWFLTDAGVSRYDGQIFTSFTKEDGLAKNWVSEIFEDREGDIWFGTSEGVSRYDGQTFITFTTEDGLISNDVRSIVQDRKEYI